MISSITKTLTAFMLTFLLASATFGQQPQGQASDRYVTEKGFKGKVFELKHREPSSLSNVLKPLGSGFKGADITYNDEMRIISVRDFPENIAAIEEAIKRLDTPKSAEPQVNLEVQVSLIMASRNAGPESADAPAAVAKVVEQLRENLKFRSYRYLNTFISRTRDGGRVDANGTADKFFLQEEIKGRQTFYTYRLENVRLVNTEGGGQVIQVRDFRFSISVPLVIRTTPGGGAEIQYRDVGINTGLTMKDGEIIVVGNSNVGSADETLIVAVSIKRVS
jgi:hypothetical protein